MSNKRFVTRLTTSFLTCVLFIGVFVSANVYASVELNETNALSSNDFSASDVNYTLNDYKAENSLFSNVLYAPEPQEYQGRPLRDSVVGRLSQLVFPEIGSKTTAETPQDRNLSRGRATIRSEQKRPPFLSSSDLDASKYSQQIENNASNSATTKSEDANPTLEEPNVDGAVSVGSAESQYVGDDAGLNELSVETVEIESTSQDDIVVDVVINPEDVEKDSEQGVATSGKDVPDAPVDLGDIEDIDQTVIEDDSTSNADATSNDISSSVSEVKSEVNVVIEEPDVDKKVLGYPDAEKAVRDMINDVVDKLKSSNGYDAYRQGRSYTGYDAYRQWRAYNARIRKNSSGVKNYELNGLCRLKWYDDLYSDPLASVGKVERASRVLAQNFIGDSNGVLNGVYNARQLMSNLQPRTESMQIKRANTADDALDLLKATLIEAKSLHAKALAPLNAKEREEIVKNSYRILTNQVNCGHTTPGHYDQPRSLILSMDKINKTALYEAGEQLLATLDPQTLAALSEINIDKLEKVTYGNNQVGIVRTEAGDILIGGRESNTWDLDSSKYRDVCCVIDLGGSDKYIEGDVCLARPLLLVIDLGQESDVYDGRKPGIQGGAVLGVSVWFDEGGDDFYRARDIAQGSAVGGFGALIDNDGSDRYLGFRRVQGAALCGFGLLLDRNGNDDYRAALFAQGFGAPGGFGALVDGDGSDHYYVGGYFFDSYPEHPGHDGWGQGVGAGIRQVACGGIGALLDCGGNDAYEFDYFGHGGGYWMGIGFARDFGGNDFRYGATSTRYDGSRRTERRWQRFGCGFGCHYACGYLFDDEGDDAYGGTIMGVGMGWDLAAGFLVDFDGDDYFGATGGRTQGNGSQESIGAILNYRGNDRYFGSGQGWADSDFSYHSPMNCGSNFSFVVDHGGKDVYGCGARNNEFKQRGRNTGFILDRPAPDEEKTSPNVEQANSSTNNKGGKAQKQQATPEDEQAKRVLDLMNAGMPTKEQNIKTQAAAPPQYDTNVHSSSNGFNNSPIDGGGFFGPGLFRRSR